METKNNLFMIDTSSKVSLTAPVKGRGSGLAEALYQVLKSSASIREGTKALVRVCELAYGQRNFEVLNEAGKVLCSLPHAQAREYGLYYQAIVTYRHGNRLQANAIFESLVDSGLRIRALQSLAADYHKQGQLDEAFKTYNRIIEYSTNDDASTVASTLLNLSAISSAHGKHDDALESLRLAWPVVKRTSRLHPHLFYVWHNEMAFELCQVREIEQAKKAVRVAVESKLAEGYPEWRETAAEIAQAERTRIVVVVAAQSPEPRPQQKVIIRFPVVESRARRRSFKPTTGRAPDVRSIIERVATVAPIHAPPAFRNYRTN
jgi:tetratricopeptide (TPR) repeat protein